VRDNLTGSATWHLSSSRSLGVKLNAARNSFSSSGQIPLDEVSAGRLDPFGLIDPSNGGRIRSGVLGVYFRNDDTSGGTFKVDGFLGRSLFDLFSNFTFFLNDQVLGDGIQQHDSRLQEGVNVQYLRPFRLLGRRALLAAGSNIHSNQINVGLYPQTGRVPTGVATRANANVTNTAGYIQQGLDLVGGRLHLEGGVRYDHFHFEVRDMVVPDASGRQGAARFQPKAGVAFSPVRRLPFRLHANYGRGISSQDARGVVQRPDSPRLSTTDFYQAGATLNFRRFSLSTDLFLIDRSNEQVYIPDDGSVEFKGPSRAYGYEAKTSVQLTRSLALNGGVTKVTNAFYRRTSPRLYVDSAPHAVADAALVLSRWRGFSGSLRLRYINSYRLDGVDPSIRAAGHTVLDISLVRSIHRHVDLNLSVDNVGDRLYYETQNYFESRVRPGDSVIARIHATPGYPRTLTAGLTFHFGDR
jgi:outer membrane receptor protein involved in Fe transport